MTRKELALCDGREGRAAYVAVNGTVYDFTDSELWREGNHQDLHYAGTDLGAELLQAPPVRAVIERFPVVGALGEAAPVTGGGTGKGIILAVIVVLAALLAAWLLSR